MKTPSTVEPEAALPFLDLSDPEFSTRSLHVSAARDRHWCARTPYGLAILRHHEAGQILRDRRLRQGSHAWPATIGLEGSFSDFWSRSIISQEGGLHRQMRTLASKALSREFIESLQPAFTTIATDLCADLNGRDNCEFMQDYATPYAGRVIAALLALPRHDWPMIADHATSLGLAMGVSGRRHQHTVNAACDSLMTVAEDLIARAERGADRDGYVARLLAHNSGTDTLSREALRDLIVISIFGGVDTTRAQLGIGMALFAHHPAQWQALRAQPELSAKAVEEIIRAHPTTTWSTRETVEAITINGMTIPAGKTIHILVHATARDPAVCCDPAFDIRVRRKLHFGFGGGAHTCLGQGMARADLGIALRTLSASFQSVSVGGSAEWLPDTGNTGPTRLPLRFRCDDDTGRRTSRIA